MMALFKECCGRPNGVPCACVKHNTEPTWERTLINTGGMMECCVQTIVDWSRERAQQKTIERQTLTCLKERDQDDRLMLVDNTWVYIGATPDLHTLNMFHQLHPVPEDD